MATAEALKKRKKIWVPILAPKEFKVKDVGDSNVYMPDQLLNKIIEVNLANLMQDSKRQNTNVTLKVVEIKENKGVTELIAYDLSPSYIKRLNRMNKGKAEQSIIVKTKDGKTVRIKVLAIAKFKTQNSVLTAVRNKMKEFLTNSVQSTNFNDLMGEIITFEYQKKLSRELKTVYPLSYILVRSIRLLK